MVRYGGCWFLLVFLTGVFEHVLVQCVCPDEWTSFGGSCYVLIDRGEDWVRANDVCKTFSSSLADITSSSENVFVKRFSKNKAVGAVWVGGNDLLSRGKWVWVSTGQKVSFSDWAPGEPGGSARCMQLWPSKGYQWDDANCDTKIAFLCETSSNLETVIG